MSKPDYYEKLDASGKAEFDACEKFLLSKLGNDAVENLVNAGLELVINTAKSLKVQFDQQEVCQIASRLATEKADMSKFFKKEVQPIIEEMLPLAEGIITEGKQGWSRTGSRKLQDNGLVNFTLRAINPEFDSEAAKAARASENTVAERLAKMLDKRFRSIVELVKFERGTKSDGTKQIALFKNPIKHGGLIWQVYLGDTPKQEADAD